MSDAEELDHGADDLLRRALIDAESSAAVALSVGGLPVSDEVTVIFHGRRDLGTIQTYVAPGQVDLQMATPIPVVMKKCTLCHPAYEKAKAGEPIGALGYTIPVE